MREALKRLTSESVVYGLGQVGGRAVQLLLVPILTRALAPQAFGVWELVLAYSQTAALVLVMGMDGALARFFYQEPDRAARIRMVSTSLAFRMTVTLAAVLVIAAIAAPLAGQLLGGEVYRKYLQIGAMTLPVTLLVMFSTDVLRVTFQPWKFIALNMTQTVLVTSVSLWMVLHMKLGVVGVLYGRLAGDGVASLLGLVLIRHTLRPRFDLSTLRRMLSYGLPLIPASIGFGWIAGIDRFVLQRTRSLEEVAVYAVAAKFFAVVTIAASAFQLAYGPFAFSRAGTAEAPRLYARVMAAYVAAASLGALLVGAFAPELLSVLVPAGYQGAAVPALVLAFAAVALGTYTVASVGVGLALKTPWLGVSAGAAALAATVANAFLTPRFGGPGAACATLAGYGTGAFFTYVIAQRVHPLPYRGGRALFLFALAAALAVAGQWGARGTPLLAGVAIKLAAAAAYVGVCVWLRIWKESGAVGHLPRVGPSSPTAS